MDEAKLYWTVVVAVVGAGWAVAAFIRDRVSYSVERSSALITRLIEYDKLNIENPDIQKYISQNAARAEKYFRNEKVLKEDIFFKAKSLVYKQLNLFDEVLSMSAKSSGRWGLFRPAALVEISDWEEYIKEKLRHPLCRSILNNEKHIFGASLRDFWERNRKMIESKQPDPFIW